MKRIVIVTLFVAFSFYSFSQNPSEVRDVRDTRKSLTISFCPTELIYNYHTIFLDYRMSKWIALGLNIGYIKPDYRWLDGYDFLGAYYGGDPAINPSSIYSGTVIKAYAKFFVDKESNKFFIEPMIVYKDLHYNWVNFEYNYNVSENKWWSFDRSEKTKQFAANFIVGWKTNLFRYAYFEMYSGVGIGERFRNYTTYSWYDEGTMQQDPEKLGHFTETKTHLVIPLGIKLGFTIYAKK